MFINHTHILSVSALIVFTFYTDLNAKYIIFSGGLRQCFLSTKSVSYISELNTFIMHFLLFWHFQIIFCNIFGPFFLTFLGHFFNFKAYVCIHDMNFYTHNLTDKIVYCRI